MSSEHALSVDGLGKQYRIGALKPSYRTVRELIAGSAASLAARVSGRLPPRQPVPTIWALKDVSFDVRPGEVVGVIGGNGAGKSTLLKILSRITEPTEGGATVYGRVGSLLEVGTGFHPELTGRENIFLNGAMLGMSRAYVASRFDAIVEFSGIGAFIDTAVRFYSSGMYVRLAFAVAAHMEPEILVVDEVLAVGDAEFQQRCLGKMNDVSREGRTILFVSHNLEALQRLCTRGLLLSSGRLIADGPVGTVVRQYREMTLSGDTLGGFNAASRRGTGWARFTDVRLMDGPERTGRRAADDDLDLEMDVAVAGIGGGSLRGLLIEVVISAGDGQPLCSLMTVDAGTALPDAGATTVRLRIPGPAFIPGRYRLRVFLGVPFLQHVDEIDDALEFEIQPPRMPWRPYELSPMRGHVCVRGEWDTDAGRTREVWALKPAAVAVDVQS
jgi:lipopolysaccharide transport system ATP-binding protein